MSPKKMIGLSFAAPAAKLCEAFEKLSAPLPVSRQRGCCNIEFYRNTKNSITIRYANASVIGASASAAVSRQSSSRSTVPS